MKSSIRLSDDCQFFPSEQSSQVKQYNVISYQERQRLIQKVISKEQTIREAAEQMDIHLSTAKYIVKSFRKKGKILKKNIQDEEEEENKSLENLNSTLKNGQKLLKKAFKKKIYISKNKRKSRNAQVNQKSIIKIEDKDKQKVKSQLKPTIMKLAEKADPYYPKQKSQEITVNYHHHDQKFYPQIPFSYPPPFVPPGYCWPYHFYPRPFTS